ncbi:hypothetical protein LWI29_033506 [Acer saccharum]|uniref:Uncharacterized protein n=1 Tax=Acer saccharum TaxID=4024 RepID=A0AA39SAY8_ACESA|nr:hypothetical protein LWI29_033506 [Acer saccharum]
MGLACHCIASRGADEDFATKGIVLNRDCRGDDSLAFSEGCWLEISVSDCRSRRRRDYSALTTLVLSSSLADSPFGFKKKDN